VRAAEPGSAARVRPMAVESGRRVRRAADPGRLGIAGTRANETMMRAAAVFVGREVRGVAPSLPLGRPGAAEGVFRDLSPGGAIR